MHITRNPYGELPGVRKKIASRRIRLSARTERSLPEASEAPSQQTGTVVGNTWASFTGMSHINILYVDVLKKDAGVESTGELATCTEDRDDRRC